MESDIEFSSKRVSIHECGPDANRYPYAIYRDSDGELHCGTGDTLISDWYFIIRCDTKETAYKYMDCLENKPGPWYIYEDLDKRSQVFSAAQGGLDGITSRYILRSIVFDCKRAESIVSALNSHKRVCNIVYDQLTVFKWLSEGKNVLRRLCHPGISNTEMGDEGWESYDPTEDLFSEDYEYMREDELWPQNMHISFEAEFRTSKELEEFLKKIREIALYDSINIKRI